jgi:predicted nucleic acid-binding protein
MSETPKPLVVIDTQLVLRATLNLTSLLERILFTLRDNYVLAVSPEVRAEIYDILTRPKIRQKFTQLTDEAVKRTMAVEVLNQHVKSHIKRTITNDKIYAIDRAIQ